MVWFLFLMAYQSSWVIKCQIHSWRTTTVMLFNPYLGRVKEFNIFSSGISLKVNITIQLEFEHSYNNVAVKLVNHYTTGTSSNLYSCSNHHHHHHHVVPPAQISLTISRHFPLSFIASGRSSGLHPISSQSCCMYVHAGCPAFELPCVGVHRSTSLLQQCPACLVRLTWIVFMMGGRWSYSWCFVGCCLQDLFNIACSILV